MAVKWILHQIKHFRLVANGSRWKSKWKSERWKGKKRRNRRKEQIAIVNYSLMSCGTLRGVCVCVYIVCPTLRSADTNLKFILNFETNEKNIEFHPSKCYTNWHLAAMKHCLSLKWNWSLYTKIVYKMPCHSISGNEFKIRVFNSCDVH